MNHRQRVLAALAHQPVDRVPTDMWATPEVVQKLYAHFNIVLGTTGSNGKALNDGYDLFMELFDRLDIDGIINVAPPYIGPTRRNDGDTWENEWGMGYRNQNYSTGVYGEQVLYPLAEAETISDLQAYRWPDPDWYDYRALPSLIAQSRQRAICVGYTAVFYYHNLLRGLELSLMDPLERPEFTQYLEARLSDFFNEYHRRCFEATRGLADMTQVTDDYGSQTGLMISPRIYDTFYRGPMQRAIDLAHSYGLKVFHHDDGDCRKLLPRLTEMGIDLLNPIQWRCGNWDLAALKRDYGEKLCFHSAVDNQYTLPFGTPEEVRAEVKMLVAILANDHTGFILGPCHNLQPNTSIENILAMYSAAREFGSFLK